MKVRRKIAYVVILAAVFFHFRVGLMSDWTSTNIENLFDQPQKRNIANDDSGLKSIKLPLGYTAANIPYIKNWDDYLRAMEVIKNVEDEGGIEISLGSNISLVRFNREPFRNECFGKLASYFYDEILRQDLRFYAKNDLENRKMGSKAGLADKVGQGIYSNMKPGWLWEMALKYSQGDQTLAFQLLGVCGHDDAVSDVNVKMYGLAPEAEKRRDKYLNFYKGKRQNVKGSIGQVLRSYYYRECPNTTSLMFLAGSLGSEVDLDSGLKNRISSIQAPAEGPTQLPSKYYHVIGSAFTACLALERCPDSIVCPRVFRSVQESAINIYRGKDICGKVSDRGTSDKPQKDFQIIFQKRFPNTKDICNTYYDVQSIENMLTNVRYTDCPRTWEKSRCEAALLKLKTFKVDFEWSRAQHDLGYTFAKTHCPLIGQTKDPLNNSCEALKNAEVNATKEYNRQDDLETSSYVR